MAFTVIAKSSDHFDCPTWVGSDSTTTINGMGFKPDSLWIKKYNSTGNPVMNNSTGGTAKNWIPSGDNAVNTTVHVASYTSDGFTLTGNIDDTNNASFEYMAACWKVNGAATSSNSDGSITSTVQANTVSGVSIVQFTGTGANATVGHGLGVAPKYIIVKSLATSGRGRVYNGGATLLTDPQTDSGTFANTAADTDDATAWNDTATTSSVFSLGSSALSNANTQECIAYCFAEVQGFSKFGFYEGSGNATKSTVVYCGFKPKWIMIKNRDVIEDWANKVSGLTGYGLGGQRTRTLKYNSNASETASTVTITSNGFRVTSTDVEINGENQEYGYMAFAEMPMVGTNGTIALAT